MNDQELATFLGFKETDDQSKVAKYVADLSPEKRAMMEKMLQIEMWDKTEGAKPCETSLTAYAIPTPRR